MSMADFIKIALKKLQCECMEQASEGTSQPTHPGDDELHYDKHIENYRVVGSWLLL